MKTQRQFKSSWAGSFCVLICAAAVGLFAGFASGAEKQGSAALARYMSRYLRNISADEGINYLSEAGIGTASKFPNSNMLLVTGLPAELVKAKALLGLVDSDQKFVVKTLFADSQVQILPANSRIAAVVGDIQIGTFSDPPRASTDHARAIIDSYEGCVLLISPADKAESIISAIERLKKETASLQSPSLAEFAGSDVIPERGADIEIEVVPSKADEIKTKVSEREDDEFFDKLLESLAVVEEEARKAPKPNEICEVPAAPKKEQLQEAEISAIVKKLVAREVAATLKSMQQQKAEPAFMAKVEAEAEPVAAERTYEPEITYNADEMLDLDLPEKLEIADLLRLVGEYLQLDYMYDPEKIKGSVTLKLRGPIKIRDLYPLLESTLKFKGFVMTRKGNLVIIVPAAEVMSIDPDLHTDRRKIKVGDVIITRVFKLKHVDTASAENLLKGMQLGITITPIPATKTLIVTAYAFRMGRVEQLLEMIDKPGEPKQFRFRQLQYTMAEVLAPKIKALAEQLGTISITVGAPSARPAAKPAKGRAKRPARPAAKSATAATKPEGPTVYLDSDVRTNRILMIGLERQLVIVEELITALDVEQQDLRALRMYDIQYVGAEDIVDTLGQLGITGVAPSTARGTTRARTRTTTSKGQTPARSAAASGEAQEPKDQPQVVIVESTNSLLINATAEQHVRIATIIGYVDSEQIQAATNYVVYPLENQDPEELGEVLTKLIAETITQADAKDTKIQRTTTTSRIEDDVVIVPDPATYSLIVYASKRNQQWISRIIEQLDEYRAQVLLDVTLVAITKDNDFQFGLDILTKYPTISKVGQIAGDGGVLGLIAGIITGEEGAGPEPFPGRFWEAESRQGIGKFFYNDDHVQALLEAIDERNWGRVLSRPKLLVNDNQEGQIIQDRTIYITETEVTSTTATGPTSVQEQVTFTPYVTGIDLTIKPHISKGNQLRLEIALTRNDFESEPKTVTVNDKQIEKPPNERKNELNSTVTVPDGYTVILGGIESINQSKTGKKVPLLGDIPIIGGLFNTIKNADEQSRLYIFIKAHILRPSKVVDDDTDIVRVSRQNRRAFEKLEDSFQRVVDWPGFEPEPMDPLKVLEED